MLRQLPERLDIVGRTRKHPDFHHVVNAPSQGDDRAALGQKLCGKIGIGTLFKSALNRRSLETTTEWGEKFKRQLRSVDLLALPDFMRPRELTKAAMTAPSLSPSAPKFTATAPAPPAKPAKRLVCARCDVKISFPEGKFC